MATPTVTDLGSTLRVEGDWTTQFRRNTGNETLVDATGATFIQQNDDRLAGNTVDYPCFLDAWQNAVEFRGGTINGTISTTADWAEVYGYVNSAWGGNSAGVFMRGFTSPMTVSNWVINQTFDGIRCDVAFAYRENPAAFYTIKNCRVHGSRDDATEADTGISGLIEDCLFEDCFSGISTGDSNTPASAFNNEVTLRRVLLHKKNYSYQGVVQGGPVLKASETRSPRFRFEDCVIAVPDANHIGYNQLQVALNRQNPASSGNFYLNLSDTPLPGNYPKMPTGWTLLQGSAARAKWTEVRTAYLTGGTVDPGPTPTGQILSVLDINPVSGAIRIKTPEAYSASITVGVATGSTRETSSITLTVA